MGAIDRPNRPKLRVANNLGLEKSANTAEVRPLRRKVRTLRSQMSVAAHAHALVEVAGEETAAHGRSVAELAGAVAQELGLAPAARQELELAALLHDIGKSAYPTRSSASRVRLPGKSAR